MKREDFAGNLRNYNGTGIWAIATVQQRYREYCAISGVAPSRSLTPREHSDGNTRWVYPIMDEVIRGIEDADPACIALGVDFVHEGALFPFGATLKSNTARALRRATLTEPQKARLRDRIVTMLIRGIIPREMREYSKLLRTIGVADHWPRLEQHIPRNNPYAMRFYHALRSAFPPHTKRRALPARTEHGA